MLRRFLMTIAVFATTPALADNVEGPVRHATAEWTGFTNKDGTGLYNELFREIFATHDLTVDVSYMPLNRAVAMVSSGEMDFTGGFEKDDRNFATHPVYETTYSVIYPADRDIDFTDLESLEGLKIVGPPQVKAEVDFQMSELDSRAQAVRMLVNGRADAFVDLHELVVNFVETGTVVDVDDVVGDSGSLDIDPDEWSVEKVQVSRLFILFSDDPRGQALRDIYDAGTEALSESGRLQEIYDAYGLATPTITPQG